MDNWNYDKAIDFIESIPDSVAKRLTKVFLDNVSWFVHRKKGYPESEFDLLFFVRSTFELASDTSLLRSILDGNPLTDEAWDIIGDEIDKHNT